MEPLHEKRWGSGRLLLADRSPLVRRLVHRLALRNGEFGSVVAIDQPQELAQAVREQQPDIVILEPSGRTAEWKCALQELQASVRRLKVLVYSEASVSEIDSVLLATPTLFSAAGLRKRIEGPSDEPMVRDCLERALKRLSQAGPGFRGRISRTFERNVLGAQPRAARCVVFDVVVVGASTGGPDALVELLLELPSHFSVPVLVVQHMLNGYSKSFAAYLQRSRNTMVREARDGMPLVPGEVWIAPDGHHLEVARVDGELVARLTSSPPLNACRPSVDALFRSASRAAEGRVLAIVLTGMGRDGFQGARDIHIAGGTVLAQDPSTSTTWGMPGSVTRAGIADDVLPVSEIAGRFAELISHVSPVHGEVH